MRRPSDPGTEMGFRQKILIVRNKLALKVGVKNLMSSIKEVINEETKKRK